MLRALLIALLLVPCPARADEITAQEAQRSRLEGHRARLEVLLAEQSRRISRLKGQPAGLQRDRQLGAALRENQALADRLTRLSGQLRDLTQSLIKLHDKALSRPGLNAEERSRLERRRTALAEALASGSTRIATGGKASPLDTPDELEEKADLLLDSEEKVRRQLRQVQTKLAVLQRRAQLERHAKAADDSPFVEDSPRRSGGARKVSTGPAAEADRAMGSSPGAKAQAPASPAEPSGPPSPYAEANNMDSAAAKPGFGGAAEAPPSPPGGVGAPHLPSITRSTDTVISIRDVLDPALLRDPSGVESRESLRARIAALKKAGERLKQVAGKLASQASDLRRRARSLRTQH